MTTSLKKYYRKIIRKHLVYPLVIVGKSGNNFPLFKEALENQFVGMSEQAFSYDDYMAARQDLIKKVKGVFTETDKEFFLSFEQGEPNWSICYLGDISYYPSIKWKLQNIVKFKSTNPEKFNVSITKLHNFLFPEKKKE